MTVGVPREIMRGERRVAATPATVEKMVAHRLNVIVEQRAGEGSYIADDDYRRAGAEFAAGAEELYARADVVLKVKQPLWHDAAGKHEVEMMRGGQILVTFLHPASPASHDTVRRLSGKGVVALTLDCVPRITRAQPMDALTSMSTVAGYKAVLMAADRLGKFVPMVGTAVGVVEPAVALVVGVGVAGLQALATAKRLGAVIRAADIRPTAREQARSLGAALVDLPIPEQVALDKAGNAARLSEEWLEKERQALAGPVAQADMLILAAMISGRKAPVLVTESMVKSMKPGSAIIDVAIDQGGNCEASRSGQVAVRWGVSIDATPNIPGMLPVSATRLFAENIVNFLFLLVKDGRILLDASDEILRPCLVTRNGEIVHEGTLEAMREAAAGKEGAP